MVCVCACVCVCCNLYLRLRVECRVVRVSHPLFCSQVPAFAIAVPCTKRLVCSSFIHRICTIHVVVCLLQARRLADTPKTPKSSMRSGGPPNLSTSVRSGRVVQLHYLLARVQMETHGRTRRRTCRTNKQPAAVWAVRLSGSLCEPCPMPRRPWVRVPPPSTSSTTSPSAAAPPPPPPL
jgi:hypothetical protein